MERGREAARRERAASGLGRAGRCGPPCWALRRRAVALDGSGSAEDGAGWVECAGARLGGERNGAVGVRAVERGVADGCERYAPPRVLGAVGCLPASRRTDRVVRRPMACDSSSLGCCASDFVLRVEAGALVSSPATVRASATNIKQLRAELGRQLGLTDVKVSSPAQSSHPCGAWPAGRRWRTSRGDTRNRCRDN